MFCDDRKSHVLYESKNAQSHQQTSPCDEQMHSEQYLAMTNQLFLVCILRRAIIAEAIMDVAALVYVVVLVSLTTYKPSTVL